MSHDLHENELVHVGDAEDEIQYVSYLSFFKVARRSILETLLLSSNQEWSEAKSSKILLCFGRFQRTSKRGKITGGALEFHVVPSSKHACNQRTGIKETFR